MMTFDQWWDGVANTPAPDTFKRWEESCRQAFVAGREAAQQSAEPVNQAMLGRCPSCDASPQGMQAGRPCKVGGGCVAGKTSGCACSELPAPQTPVVEQPERIKELEDAAYALLAILERAGEGATVGSVINKLEALREQLASPQDAKDAEHADMFWNDDDAERNHDSIEEFLNEEICNGMGVEVGAEFTLRRAVSLSNIKIRVTAVNDEECEAEYEVIDAAIAAQGAGE